NDTITGISTSAVGASGYLQTINDGSGDTLIQVDIDGPNGPAGWTTILKLANLLPGQITTGNLDYSIFSGWNFGGHPGVYLAGNSGDDLLTGTSGNDTFSDDQGNNNFTGNGGWDLFLNVSGGTGANVYSGGPAAHADTYIVTWQPGDAAATITD